MVLSRDGHVAAASQGPHPPPRHSLLLRPLLPFYSALPTSTVIRAFASAASLLCALPRLSPTPLRLAASPPAAPRSLSSSERSIRPSRPFLRITAPFFSSPTSAASSNLDPPRPLALTQGESRVFAFLRSRSRRPPRFRFARLSAGFCGSWGLVSLASVPRGLVLASWGVRCLPPGCSARGRNAGRFRIRCPPPVAGAGQSILQARRSQERVLASREVRLPSCLRVGVFDPHCRAVITAQQYDVLLVTMPRRKPLEQRLPEQHCPSAAAREYL
ncbi:hypothetical protein B0H13DRAFT_2536092 [Mycena leptocephala]|nr:hypothetical protein B0H13DRAFT_2536092 [Mycena leptocephala]